MKFEVEFERDGEEIRWRVAEPLTGASVYGSTHDGPRPTRDAMRKATRDVAFSIMSYISSGGYHDVKEEGR